MNNISPVVCNHIKSMSDNDINDVKKLGADILSVPQTRIPTDHVIHAGMYARTIMIPAGVVAAGVLMKVATILIVYGDFIVRVNGESVEMHGYHVFAGSTKRQQAFVALTDTHMTMLFATDAKTVEEVEEEFTDEAHMLWSRYDDAINHVMITGDI